MAAEVEYRTYAFEQTPAEMRALDDGDGRTVECIAVPYGYRQEIYPGFVEQFLAGAFRHQLSSLHRVHFSREHMAYGGDLIGRVHEGEETARGLKLRTRVSDIQVANDTLTLIRDKVLTEVSIGFRPEKDRTESDGTVSRVKATLTEISVVLQGAYGRKAVVTGVRSAGTAGELRAPRDAAQWLARLMPVDVLLPDEQLFG